jgi:hypothetical protein
MASYVLRHGKRIEIETYPGEANASSGLGKSNAAKPKRSRDSAKSPEAKKFAYVPLDNDWGYRVLTIAGRGAGIVAHALYVQRTTGKGDVPITAELMQRCGIRREVRWRALRRLVAAGVATVRHAPSGRGGPLLTCTLGSNRAESVR